MGYRAIKQQKFIFSWFQRLKPKTKVSEVVFSEASLLDFK